MTDDEFPTDESNGHHFVAGQSQNGKTHQIGTELARRLADDTDRTGFIDSKGDCDGQHLVVESLDSDGDDERASR